MQTKRKFLLCFKASLCAAVALPLLAPSSVRAADEAAASKPPIQSVEEFRDLMLKMSQALAAGSNDAADRLQQQLQAPDWQALEYAYRARKDWSDLQTAVELMNTPAPVPEAKAIDGPVRRDAGIQPAAMSPNGLPNALFAASYTTGQPFDTWKATLPGLGGISDTNGDGSLADERCDTNFEAGIAIAAAVFNITNVAIDIGCHAAPELLDIPCFAAQAVVALAGEANGIVVEQCNLADGAVDAVELEAAFENVNGIWGNLDAHHGALTSHDVKLANHDVNLATHDAFITSLINQHDLNIQTRLALHDSEIKALLANVQAGVDANGQALKVVQGRQEQILRLLLTPEGRRAIDPAVMTCTGDDCPPILDCPGEECSFPVRP